MQYGKIHSTTDTIADLQWTQMLEVEANLDDMSPQVRHGRGWRNQCLASIAQTAFWFMYNFLKLPN